MKRARRLFLIAVLAVPLILSGCWNYREIDTLAIVAGVAVDPGKEKKYEVTVEIVMITGGKESITESQILSMEGDTFFDAVRNQILVSGMRLYWSHGQIIVINQDIAREGFIGIMDWYIRDSETREDVKILISKEDTAKKILTVKGPTDEITSYFLHDMITSQKSVSKAPQTEVWQFINDITSEGVAAIVPTVELTRSDDKEVPSVRGTAVFKKDKLVGFLDESETMALLFIKNDIKSGVLVQKAPEGTDASSVSLEIFNNKCHIRPVKRKDSIEVEIETHTEVAIDEIQGTEDFLEKEKNVELEKAAGDDLKKDIENLIYKVQKEFSSDIFGFGAKIHAKYPKVWKEIGKDWDNHFKELKVNVTSEVHIRHSAMLSKPIKLGD